MRTLTTTFLAIALVGATGCAIGSPDLEENETEITHGELDGNAHPAVVLLLMEENGVPAFRCSASRPGGTASPRGRSAVARRLPSARASLTSAFTEGPVGRAAAISRA